MRFNVSGLHLDVLGFWFLCWHYVLTNSIYDQKDFVMWTALSSSTLWTPCVIVLFVWLHMPLHFNGANSKMLLLLYRCLFNVELSYQKEFCNHLEGG